MTSHTLYVAAAYGISVLSLGSLLCWILIDQITAKRALARLEAQGVRRRSPTRTPS